MLEFRWLTLITLLPAAGGLIAWLLPKNSDKIHRIWALGVSLITFVLSLPLYFIYMPIKGDANSLWLMEKAVPWIPAWGASWHMGIDGISLFLVLLTTFLCPLCVLCSWSSIQNRVKEFFLSLLFLEAAMVGVFCALDLLLFYVFWEAMLIPMILLIGVWGGGRRIYSAIKFLLFTMAGSVLMLVAILVLYHSTGSKSFDLTTLLGHSLSRSTQIWLFFAFAVAFAIKVPMVPFHTWLPDAHVDAPTAGSVILAGVLLKMGTYGFLRFAMPLFPDIAISAFPIIVAIALFGIVYGALVAMVQPDLKKLVAYSSVSHLGFCMLGMFAFNPQGMSGSLLQMINHGLSTGALFILVGIIYERRHSRMIADFGGIAAITPAYAALFVIISLSSIGLPGTNGFIGEFLILLGAFRTHKALGVIGATGVILAACYMLWMVQRFLFGQITNEENRNLTDVNFREIITLLPILIFVFWIGVYPSTFLKKMEPSIDQLLQDFRAKRTAIQEQAPMDHKNNFASKLVLAKTDPWDQVR